MYHPVVSKHTQMPQTKSQQVPFYFGGSQVPLEVGELKGKGMIKLPSVKPTVIMPNRFKNHILPYNVK